MDLSPASAADGAGPAAATTRALLRMAVGVEVLALPIAAVREILQAPRLTPLPRTPAFVRGVMNLRGAVVPVIDLAARLADRHDNVTASSLSRRSCVVVVELTSGEGERAPSLGLLVDAVHEVFDIDAGEIEPVPPLGTCIGAEFLAGMVRGRGQVIALLALERVLDAADLAALIEHHALH
jgi:purine-binding chemotaxis protein CheW